LKATTRTLTALLFHTL